MTETITIIKCGTPVMITAVGVKAMVSAYNFRFGRSQYGITYWSGLEYKEIWMDRCEFEITYEPKQKIGF